MITRAKPPSGRARGVTQDDVVKRLTIGGAVPGTPVVGLTRHEVAPDDTRFRHFPPSCGHDGIRHRAVPRIHAIAADGRLLSRNPPHGRLGTTPCSHEGDPQAGFDVVGIEPHGSRKSGVGIGEVPRLQFRMAPSKRLACWKRRRS